MQQYKSKNHWRLNEKKCPVWLWQNKVLVQYFISWRCQYKASVPRACWGHLREWNATTQVQKPLKIIWEKVPNSAIAEQGPSATFYLLEVPIQGLGTEGLLRPPQGMECHNTSPKTIEDYMRKSAHFRYGRIGSWCNTSVAKGANY
jgi:hypothetical protein